MQFRLASVQDLQQVIQLRKQLLIDEGQIVTANIDEELKRFFEQQFASNQYVQWFVEQDERIVATGAIQFMAFPPSYFNQTGIRGYICNMFTDAAYRGQGIAKEIIAKLLAEAKSRNVHHLFLLSSEMGKPVYKKIGFQQYERYMEYFLPRDM